RSRTARLHLGGHGPRGGSAARRVLALSLLLGVDEPLPIDTGTSAEGRVPLAAEDPVARVLIDHPVPHLARVFDYAVPEKLAEAALPGVRVRVKFAGKLRDGYLIVRVDSSDHLGPLATLQRVSGPVQVLQPALRALCEATARRYGRTLADVLRLAISPRHERRESTLHTEEIYRKSRTTAAVPGDMTEYYAALSGTTAEDASMALSGASRADEGLLGHLDNCPMEAAHEVTDEVGPPG